MFKIRVKRFLAVLAASCCLVTAIPIQSFAAPAKTEYYDFMDSAYSRLRELGSFLEEPASGQSGLLIHLRLITEYALYVQFLRDNKTAFDLKDEDLDVYDKHLFLYAQEFNSRFSRDGGDRYVALKLPIGDKDLGSVFYSSLIGSSNPLFVTYLNSVAVKVNDRLNEGDESSVGVLSASLYNCVNGIEGAATDLGNLTPFQTATSLHKEYSLPFSSALQKLVNDYSKVFALGAEVAEQINMNSSLEIDLDAKNYLENMADVVAIDEGSVQIPVNPELKLAYLAIFATSSVYTPFKSYVGDTEFIEALKSIPSSAGTSSDIEQFFNNTKDNRKPLYYRKINSRGAPTGAAKLVSIADFISMIEDGSSGALCTVEGKFMYDAEKTSWVYVQDTMIQDDASEPEELSSVDGENAAYSLDENANDSLDSDTTNESNSTNGGEDTNESGDSVASADSVLKSVKDFISLKPETVWAAPSPSPSPSTSPSPSPDDEQEGTVDDTGESSEESSGESGDTSLLGTEQGDGASVEPSATPESEPPSIPANEVVTDTDKISGPVLMFGTKYAREVDNLTTLIMNNVIKDTANLNALLEQKSRYLYLNAYGDIVTDDNLVILPGAANPIYYNVDADGYNPFTVAFMNSYPTAVYQDKTFQLTTKRDIGKYLIINRGSEGGYLCATTLTSVDMIKTSAPIRCPDLVREFGTYPGMEKYTVFKPVRLIFGSEAHWSEKNTLYEYTPMLNAQSLTVTGESVFPYDRQGDVDYRVSSSIAQNFYGYLTYDENSSQVSNLKKLHDNYVLHYCAMSGLNGTNDPYGYSDDLKLKYTQFFSQSSERKIDTLTDFSRSLYEKITDVDGVIGVKDSYQDKLLGRVLGMVRKHWLIFLSLFVLCLLYAFAKMHRDFFQTAGIFLTALCVAYLFVVLVPVYLPMCYNVIINNISENLTYEVLGAKTEFYDSSDTEMVTLDEDGFYKFNTTSVTLYRVAAHKLEEFHKSLGVEEEDVIGGKTEIINQESGLYAEGDSLKINTDLLFSTLKITSEPIGSSNTYNLKSYKTVSSNTDYYVPYYLIVDSFIDKMNSLANIYFIPKTTSNYVNGTSKTNYFVYSYIHSRPFLTPGDYAPMELAEDTTLSETELEEYQTEGEALQMRLENEFGYNVDWLGISSFLYYPSDSMKKTLWAQTMQDNGYYEKDWEVNEERMNDLITYVNRVTKRFVYAVDSQVGAVSDDVMVKLIAMRALVALNQESSKFGHWLYPFSLNYEELTLKDVMDCIFTDDYTLYMKLDMDVVSYVKEKHGWFNVIVFDVLIVLLFLAVNILKYSIPIMYLLLAGLLVFKFVSVSDTKKTLKGYFKCNLLIFACSTVLCIAILCTKKMKGSLIAIYFLLFVVLFILFVLGIIVRSVLTDFVNLGDDSVFATIKNSVKFDKKAMNVNSTLVNDKRVSKRNTYNKSNYGRYGMNSSIDDLYGDYSYRNYGSSDYYYTGSSRDYSQYNSSDYNSNSASYSDSETIIEEKESLVGDSGMGMSVIDDLSDTGEVNSSVKSVDNLID